MYLFFFILLLFFSFYSYKYPRDKSFNIFRIISLLFFIGIAGLRYNIGIDYFGYSESFDDGDTLYELFIGKHDPQYEPLYDLTCMILRTLRLDAQLFFLSFSIFSSIVLFHVINFFVDRKYFFLCLLVYFSFVYLLMEMQAVRQSLAAGFLYLSFLQLLREKKINAYILVGIAFMFHSSAMIFLVIFPILDKKLRISLQLILIGTSLYIMLFKIRWIYGIIESISSFFPSAFFAARLLDYTTKDSISIERGIFITFFLYIFYYFFMIYCNRNHRGYLLTREGIIAQNLFLFYIVFTSLFWELNFISTRIGWYLLFGLVLLLPQMLGMVRSKQRVYAWAFVLLFCLIPFRAFVIPNGTTAMMVPYEGYIECKLLGFESTGRERAVKYADETGSEFRY